jgi:hypothetical protein
MPTLAQENLRNSQESAPVSSRDLACVKCREQTTGHEPTFMYVRFVACDLGYLNVVLQKR